MLIPRDAVLVADSSLNLGLTRVLPTRKMYVAGQWVMLALPKRATPMGIDLLVRGPMKFMRVLLALILLSSTVAAQKESERPVCDREQAFGLIQEQIAQSKTVDNPAARISILTQGADLLWPYRQSAARSVFEEAFEVATQDFQSSQKQQAHAANRRSFPDQRLVVIRAIARGIDRRLQPQYRTGSQTGKNAEGRD